MTASPSAPRSTRLPRRMVAAVTVATTLLAPVFLNLVGNSAFADTVTNNVTVGGNDTTTVGSTTSVSYSLNARNDPGEPGGSAKCNASTTSPVVVAVALAVPNGTTGTVSPSSLSFTDCSTAKPVTLGAGKAGNYAVSVSTTTANVTTTAAAFTLHVLAATDTTGPVLSLPSNQTAEATSRAGAPLSFTATAFDAGDNKATAVTCTPTSGSTFPIAVTTVSCSSPDSKGNPSTGTFKVTVADMTGPVLSLSDTTAAATSASGANVGFAASANDVVDGSTTVSCTPASGSQFPLGTTTVSCSSTDSRANKTTGTLKVTVQDKTAPSLTLPTTTVAEATGAGGVAVAYTASASDLVDGSVTPSCDVASGSTFRLGDTKVTCSATDKAANKAAGSFTVTVGDHTAPTLTLTDKTAEATAPDGADVTYTATASDAVDGAITPQCAPGSGSTFALGKTDVSCSATDSRSNTAMGTLHVTVQDKTPPTLTLADETAEATGPDGATVNYTASARDLVSGTVAVTCSTLSGATFGLGATTVSCSATDKAGNTASGSFAVSVKDRTAPTLVLSDQREEATGPSGAAVAYTTKATDLVDGTVSVSCSRASGATFALGTSTVTCLGTDKAGNQATDTFSVTVVRTTAPAISAASRTAEATGADGATVSYTATATDLVDGTVQVTCTVASGSRFPLGDTSVTCSATDNRNNFSHKVLTISVVDTTAPEVTTTDATAEATGPNGSPVSFTASASDAVDGSLPATCLPASGSTFAPGDTLVTCTATDAHHNTATATATVTVRDTTGPALKLADQTLEATGGGGAAATFMPTASDLVSGVRLVTCDAASGGTFAIGANTVSCSATDQAGNLTRGTFTVTVGDSTAPSLSLIDAQAEATKPAGADVSYQASATDVVDGSRPVACDLVSGSTFAIAVTTVTCWAHDTRSNAATGTLTVTVTDSTPPSLTLTDQKAEATGTSGAAVTYPTAASDIVDGPVAVSCDKASGATFPIGATTVTCTSIDAHKNVGKGSFTVTVKDTTAPRLALPGGKSAEATSAAGAVVTYTVSADDAVDGTVPATCVPASGTTFALGTRTVTCSATDEAGNTASDSFPVVVADSIAPVLTVGNVTAEATSSAGAAVSYVATAGDTVDGATAVSCTIPSGSTFKLGDTFVTCNTADRAGNAASSGFTVTVQDTTAPRLAKPADLSLTATSAAGAVASYAAAAADAVDGTVAATCTPPSGSTFALGTTQVSCSAKDAHGNTGSSQVFNVTVTAPWSNVLAPLNSDGSSVYKIGSTIPVKFQLTGTAAGITNLPARLSYAKVSTGTVGTELEAASTTGADTGNVFRYDSTARQYIFNLSTKGFTEGTYQLRVDLGDGVAHTVKITSRK